jgi:hypothetical protein
VRIGSSLSSDGEHAFRTIEGPESKGLTARRVDKANQNQRIIGGGACDRSRLEALKLLFRSIRDFCGEFGRYWTTGEPTASASARVRHRGRLGLGATLAKNVPTLVAKEATIGHIVDGRERDRV